MSWGEIGGSNLSCSFVCLQRLIGRYLALIAEGELCEVTMVVSLPTSSRLVAVVPGQRLLDRRIRTSYGRKLSIRRSGQT